MRQYVDEKLGLTSKATDYLINDKRPLSPLSVSDLTKLNPMSATSLLSQKQQQSPNKAASPFREVEMSDYMKHGAANDGIFTHFETLMKSKNLPPTSQLQAVLSQNPNSTSKYSTSRFPIGAKSHQFGL